jgi:hypothetical protein
MPNQDELHWSPDIVLGAIEVGVLLSSILYGVTCVQAHTYAHSKSIANDSRWTKGLVAGIWWARLSPCHKKYRADHPGCSKLHMW